MQSFQIYGVITKRPEYNLLKVDDDEIYVLSFDVECSDGNKDNTTIIHCVTFNDMANNLSDKVAFNKSIFAQGIMKYNKFFIYKGVKADKPVFLIKNICVDGDMYLSNDLDIDIDHINALNHNYLSI